VSHGFEEWEVSGEAQPRQADYAFDLDRVLSSVVGLHAQVPPDAFTAGVLGMERMGNGVVIRDDGIVLTIGYLVTEANHVELTTYDGRTVAGHVLGFDHHTGFGLVQALEPLGVPAMPLGDSKTVVVGERVIVGGAGGRTHSVAARVVAREEFAGYWEYVLEDAIFTRPAHPVWSGAALIGPRGELLGVASLHVQQRVASGGAASLNMIVPIELLPPIYEDLLRGRTEQPGRPWLGLFAQELEGTVVVIGTASDGPARRAGLREGDIVLGVGGHEIDGLADFYRSIWALGPAGVDVPLTLDREGDVFEVRMTSRDRRSFLKSARYH